jgi:tetratricopeptide (TPR) repeat protein
MTDRHRWAIAAGLALLASLPYLNALDGDFVFDDVGVIRDNPVVQREPAWRVFTTVYEPGSLYRPITMLTYAANARLSEGAWGFHAVNVALHAFVTILVYALALRLLRAPLAAIVAAAVFAVHPIHSEAVTGIVGRAELLAALGGCVALLAFARARAQQGWRRRAWMVLSVAAFAAAVLSKESALTVIGLVLVLHWSIAPHDEAADRARALMPYGAVAIAYLGLRLLVVGAIGLPQPPGALDNVLAHVDSTTRLRTALIVLWEYVSSLAAPITLSADYSFNAVPPAWTNGDPRVLVAVAMLSGAGVAVILSLRRSPTFLLAALFFLIPLALTANLVVPIGTIKAERLLYLPSIGWCIAMGGLVVWAAAHRPRAAWIGIALVLAVLAGRTWTRNGEWRDERSLYEAAVAAAPDSAKAHHNLAVALQRAGALDDAMMHFRRALEIYPDYASAAFGIGHIYTLKGIDSGATHWYQEALRRDWQFAKAHLQLGLIRERHGEYAAAEAAFATGLECDPSNPLLLINLAAVRLAQGDRWGADAMVRRLHRVEAADPSLTALVAAAQREIEVALQ